MTRDKAKHRRRRHRSRRAQPPGTAPGTLKAEDNASPTEIRSVHYGPEVHRTKAAVALDELSEDEGTNLWIDV
ncbi:MAG: hypothetical protein AAFY88_12740, partial [Acidobacteriota bacterium]